MFSKLHRCRCGSLKLPSLVKVSWQGRRRIIPSLVLEQDLETVETTNLAQGLKDGLYRGKGMGYGGEMVVEVSVQDEKIVDIEVTEHNETPFVAGPALKRIIPAVIEEQI